jgi:hypothetical protein
MKLLKIIIGLIILYFILSFFLPIFPHYTKHSLNTYSGGGYNEVWYTITFETLMTSIVRRERLIE